MTIEVMGGKELADKFRTMGRSANTGIEQALLVAVLRVERDAKIKAPVDTGRLRSSITHRLTDEGSNPVAEVGTNVEYAKHVEFGTTKQAAQPYLYPALVENKRKILSDIATAIRKGAGL